MDQKQELNTLYHSVYSIQFHLVFVTKYRRRCITAEMLQRLEAIFTNLCVKWEGELVEFGGEPDHVHLLVSANPKVKPTAFINNLKTVSSRLIRKEFADHLRPIYWKPVFWSRSYCILSCGGAPLAIIKQYIEQQTGAE